MTSKLHDPKSWKGIWTALITPLDDDGNIDARSLRALIEDQISSGVRGLVIAGSTGEGSLLSSELYFDLLKKAVDLAQGKIPLVAGLGIGGTELCLENLDKAKRAGVDGVLASPPAYIKAPQRALVTHFLRLAEEGLPLCLYEIAGRSASSINLETIIEIVNSKKAAAKNIVALKDASGNINRALDQSAALMDRLALLSGDDETFTSFLAAGGNGVISVATHLICNEFVEIQRLFDQGQLAEAQELQAKLNPFIRGLFWESNPIPVKSLMFKLRRIQSLKFKQPLCPMKEDLLEELIRHYEKIRH